MNRVAPLANLPVALAAVVIALGLVHADRASASDKSKGAKCAAIDDAVARLACFDAAFPRPPHATAATAPPAAAPAAATATAAATAPKPSKPAAVADKPAAEAKDFGLSSKQKAALEEKPAETPPPPPMSTTASVKTVRKLPSGYLLIGLDNDQVWQQTEVDPLVHLEPGDRVDIRQASLGSFLLVTPARYSTRVRRVR